MDGGDLPPRIESQTERGGHLLYPKKKYRGNTGNGFRERFLLNVSSRIYLSIYLSKEADDRN